MRYKNLMLFIFISVTCFFSALCSGLEIHINGKTEKVVFHFSDSRVFFFDALAFSIMGTDFYKIDGNTRDVKLSEKLNAIDNDETMSFIIYVNGSSQPVTFENRFLRRFLTCVNNGLCSFIVTHADPKNMLVPGTNQTLKDRGVNSFSCPTCTEFLHYWTFGVTDFPFGDFRVFSLPDERVPSMVVELRNNSDLLYQCVYIGHGVCMGKIGELGIYFHTMDSIRTLYDEIFGVKSRWEKVQYKRDDDRDPPDASASAITI